MVILTDTDIIIDYLRRTDKRDTLFHKTFIKAVNSAAITLVTVTELWQGSSLNNKKNLKIVEELLDRLEILIPNLEIARLAGKILRNHSGKLSFQDGLIAASALYHKLPLLTKNKRDFQMIEGLKLYS